MRPKLSSSLLATFALVALLAIPGPAAAQEVDIEGLIQTAVEDFQAKRFGEAVSKFLEARGLIDDPNLDWNIARSFEEAGDCANAREWFTKVKRRKARKGDDRKKVKKNAKRARKKLKKLKRCDDSARISVTCVDEAARVVIDDRPEFACPVSILVPVGDHEVHAHLAGEGEAHRIVSLKEGSDVDVEFETLVQPKAPEPPPREVATQTPVEPPPSEVPAGDESWISERGALFWTGVALVGVGAAGFGTSFYFQSKTDDAQAEYDELVALETLDDAARQRADELKDEGESNATLANVTRFGGLGLLGAGVVLAVVDMAMGGDSDVEPTAAIDPGGHGASVGVRLRF